MPTKYGNFLLTTYQTCLKNDKSMRYIFVVQTPNLPEVPIIRIHSACLLSEIFNIELCDCNDQMKKSLKLISKKKGILFYLDQEGRGHGLFDKVRELKLQEKGYDHIEASIKLGLPVDSRKYYVVAKLLKAMKITKIRLITNNPRKIKDLEKDGIEIVERVIIKPYKNKHCYNYLLIKKEKQSHLIDI
jgi:GTP cyclohydrolase II